MENINRLIKSNETETYWNLLPPKEFYFQRFSCWMLSDCKEIIDENISKSVAQNRIECPSLCGVSINKTVTTKMNKNLTMKIDKNF